jgi:hypothetical protein
MPRQHLFDHPDKSQPRVQFIKLLILNYIVLRDCKQFQLDCVRNKEMSVLTDGTLYSENNVGQKNNQ